MDGKPGHNPRPHRLLPPQDPIQEPLPIPGPDPGLLDLGKLEDRVSRLLYSYQFQRKRRLPGQIISTDTAVIAGQAWAGFADAVTDIRHISWVLPFDWVRGTPISFHALLYANAAGTTNMVYDSDIGLSPFGGTDSLTNLEAVSLQNLAMNTNSASELVRGGQGMVTAIATALAQNAGNDWYLYWTLSRRGADANDTVNLAVFIRHVWMEYYSTYDYQNLIND